ncbi:carbon-nitrogen hydrolase family protein [Kineosporia mesophila]|uniref:Carbon-nitrogen hydrolase family protein n=1 Tax=Kineosporia mesophila TaxID=566012 RepID=A0ABP6ZQL6_9ACTN|nr:carbon-nitrogen hydrolase family protein [Kineosporia mesophila]MCD5355106.1 carbon-nitrogen hydrolase family protein [Kineosporia mesophila]
MSDAVSGGQAGPGDKEELSLRVAVGQAGWSADPLEVVGSAVRLVEAAAAQGARLLLLSELFLFGYDPAALLAAPAPENAVLPGDLRLEPLRSVCRSTGVDLLVGAVVPSGQERPRYANALLHVTAFGEISEPYRKMHVWQGETEVLAGGSAPVLLEIEGFRLGLGICYDAGFPEFARAYAQAGAHAVLFASAFAEGDERRRYDIYHAGRALESGIWVLVSNALGDIGEARFFGRSSIFTPTGEAVGVMGAEEGVLVATLDTATIEAVRSRLPYLADYRGPYVPRPDRAPVS